MNRLLKACWEGSRFCGRCVGSFALWSVWLLLVIALGVQVYIATAHELAVPRFVLREISARLSASGLRLDFERARFDPTGHVFVEGVQLHSTTLGDALLTADHLYVRLDPWDLLIRDVDLTEVRAAGVDLRVPAMLSPSGRAEPVVRSLYATLRFREDDPTFDLVEASARMANLELTATGAFTLPPARPQSLPVLDEVLRLYLDAARRAAAFTAELAALESPRLDLVFTPDAERIATVAARLQADALTLDAGRFGLPATLQLTQPRWVTRQPLRVPGDREISLRVAATAATLGTDTSVRALQLRLDARWLAADRRIEPRAVEIEASRLSAQGFTAIPVAISLRPAPDRRWQAAISAGLDDASWTFAAELDPLTRAGEIAASGDLPWSLFERLATRASPRLVQLVAYDQAPHVAVRLVLGDQARLLSASGDLVTGPVVARNVALNGVRGRFAWSGTTVSVDDIELRTPSSLAHGRYTMDTATNDFRFLLEGSLQPADINGWFRDWWPRFWSTFDFTRGTPEANVEVAGRWGRPELTTVFVGAHGRNAGLRGVALDEVATRLFIRPGYYDGLAFRAVRDGRTARGRFTRNQDLEARALAWMDVAMESNLPADLAAQLAGPEVVALTEPYRFTAPPEVKVEGRLSGPASPDGTRADLKIEGRTEAAMTFFDFPLSRLSFRALVAGERILVDDVVAGFAEGEVRGAGELSGPGPSRRLTFDARLDGGKVGEAIRIVEEFSARRAGVPPTPQSRFQQQIASGRLDLTLSAKGFADNLRSFDGSGNARITDANLGEINLLGVLSTLLRRTLLNYSTLQLDNAQASFALAGSSLVFPLVRISGPRAAIEASGTYHMEDKQLEFVTKVYPFEESRSLLGTALGTVLAPLSSVLEVNLTGRIDNPSWAFVYGPTSFFRALTGSDATSATPTAPAPTPAPSTPAPDSPTPPAPAVPTDERPPQ